jgi:hypothetical protein
MTLEDVKARLRERIAEAGGASKWARASGCSPSYVSDVLYDRRDPGPAILAALGLEGEKTFRERTQ